MQAAHHSRRQSCGHAPGVWLVSADSHSGRQRPASDRPSRADARHDESLKRLRGMRERAALERVRAATCAHVTAAHSLPRPWHRHAGT
eukprot:1490801-Rhodomonas_salina.3